MHEPLDLQFVWMRTAVFIVGDNGRISIHVPDEKGMPDAIKEALQEHYIGYMTDNSTRIYPWKIFWTDFTDSASAYEHLRKAGLIKED
jgi:hypothetical protein